MTYFFAKLLSAFIPHKKLRRKTRDYLSYKGNEKRRISKYFEKELGYPLNIENPRTFNEKLNWLKFYHKNPQMTTCADKYLVRQYIENKGLGRILIPLLDHSKTFNALKWESLPEQFVLKTNHNSGGVWIVTDKKRQDKRFLQHQINDALSRPYGRWSHELHYTRINPVVMVEKYLNNDAGELLDYKIFCFNEKPHYIQVDFDRFKNHTRSYYDLNWNKLDFSTQYPISQRHLTAPEKLDEMITTATILSKGFPHVRVDLYYVDNNIYFGELTFFHEAGYGKFSDYKWDMKMGDLLKLPAKKGP